jgi:hypothetical protein
MRKRSIVGGSRPDHYCSKMNRIRTATATLGILLLASALTGCGATSAPPEPSSEPTSAVASPDATPLAWVDYTVPSELASFHLPADWTVEIVGDIEVALLDPQGTRQITYIEQIGGIGGPNCASPVPFQVLDAYELPLAVEFTDPVWGVTPQIAFQIMEDGSGYLGTIGTTDSLAGLDGMTCGFMNVIGSPVLGTFTFATEFQAAPGYDAEGTPLEFASDEEAVDYMATDEYATLIRILTSITTG